MVKGEMIIKLFSQAVKVSSPSGREGEMAQWIKGQMKRLGWKVWEDSSGKKNASNCGNIYAYWEVNPQYPALVFCAHMDTVQGKDKKIQVVFDGQTFKSNSKTILGADNKAGIVALILAAKSLDKSRLKSNLLFFFPTREEAGLMGSSLFKFPKKKVKFVYNVDQTEKPGVFIYKSLGYLNFGIKAYGIATHAAKDYEKGKNAILVAADLLKSLPIGKNVKKGWTLNVGVIKGGKSTNVICDLVELRGELRAFDRNQMDQIISLLKNTCQEVAQKFQTQIEISLDKQGYIPPFLGRKKGKINQACVQACQKVGLKPVFKESYSTSDANSFSGQGLEVISVSRGGKNAHSNKEELRLNDLRKAINLVSEIIYLS